MDYINIPRPLIYNIRTDLKDFGVQIPGTMNNQLFSNLKEIFMATDKAKELILRCFNNAYYICTIIPFVDFPETEVAEYEKLLLKENSYDCEEVCAVSMAMVCKLLPACDSRWRSEDNDLINSIQYRFTHYQWMNSGARKSFEFMEEKQNTNGLFLPPNEFAPRDIIEVIETFSVSDLQDYAEYISERLVHLEDPRQRMLGFNTARLRIEKYQRELCENTEYNPKKDCFEYVDNYIRDLTLEERVRNCYQKSKKAIEYYTKHYPDEENYQPKKQSDTKPSISDNEKLIAENEQLKEQLAQYVSQVNELVKDNAELKDIKQQLADAQETIYEQAQTIQELKDEIEELEKEDDSSKSSENLESELNRIKEIHENTLVALLKPAFFNIEDDARDFLRRIQGLDNQGVTDVAWQFLHDNKITPSKKGRFIWTVLKAANLYNATEQNWTGALRKSN